MPRSYLKAPFPYFGGKRLVTDVVWPRLGNVDNYIEPFAGSAAMLWARPHLPRIETLNDICCYVPNFWRSIKQAPEEVADYADWPVSEADLHARHKWLVMSAEAKRFRDRMRDDPDYFDPKIAGWWCWGMCCWIGGGWCTFQDGPDRSPNLCPPMGVQRGIKKEIPNLHRPKGALTYPHSKRPSLSDGRGSPGGKGVNSKRVHLATGNGVGVGVQRKPKDIAEWEQRPGLSGDARGDLRQTPITVADRRRWLNEWFGDLSNRLRSVRVCCGDWMRVCNSPSVTVKLGSTGLFLDPPYAKNLTRLRAWIAYLRGNGNPPASAGARNRDGNLYASDFNSDVDHLVARVHVYCAERGRDRRMRIVLCGYAGEHDELEQLGWQCIPWKAHGGYGNRSEKGRQNSGRERLWFSPHCLPVEELKQNDLFAEDRSNDQ